MDKISGSGQNWLRDKITALTGLDKIGVSGQNLLFLDGKALTLNTSQDLRAVASQLLINYNFTERYNVMYL